MPLTPYDQDNAPISACGLKYGDGCWFNDCHMFFLNRPWGDMAWGCPWYPTGPEGVDIHRNTYDD